METRFNWRIRRLAATSSVALGVIWWLATHRLDAAAWVGPALAAGWGLMPVLLVLSLRWPVIRYGLVVPSLLVGVSLLAACLTALPLAAAARLGWLCLTVGIWFGGLLGGWFWFGWLPVPERLRDPFGVGRWELIGCHVGLVVGGIALISTAG